MALAGESVGRVADERDPLVGALVLVAAFGNSGNLGIPVSDFAFGDVGRQTAVLWMSVQSVLLYTLGVYVASGPAAQTRWPASGRCSASRSCTPSRPRWPRALDVVPPADTAGMEALGLVGDSAIPVMLLVLGLQLARTNYGPVLSGTGLRRPPTRRRPRRRARSRPRGRL